MRGQHGAQRMLGAVAWTVAAAGFGASGLAGQGLAAYDYDNLRLRGAGVEIFYVSPNDLDATVGIGARLDLGFLGPNVRVVPRFAFWDSELEDAEVNRLERRLEDLVAAQNPGEPRPTVEFGSVDQDAIIFGTDLHWVPSPEQPIRPYLGFGGEIYILNGSGDAIDGTFVEDRLDLLTAGVSGVAGLELGIRGGLTLYGELRGSLVADVRSVALTAGLAYIAP